MIILNENDVFPSGTTGMTAQSCGMWRKVKDEGGKAYGFYGIIVVILTLLFDIKV